MFKGYVGVSFEASDNAGERLEIVEYVPPLKTIELPRVLGDLGYVAERGFFAEGVTFQMSNETVRLSGHIQATFFFRGLR